MKTVRYQFSHGVTAQASQQTVPDGYCVIAENVDLRSGFRPLSVPGLKQYAPSIERIWEYRGQWFTSTAWRDYCAERVGVHTRIYFTEPSPTYGDDQKLPSKIVDGTEANLGTSAPISAPSVTADSYLYPSVLATFVEDDFTSTSVTLSTPAGTSVYVLTSGTQGPISEGSYSYRVAPYDYNDNPIVACPSVSPGTVDTDQSGRIFLTIKTVSYDVKGYIIYGRTEGASYELTRIRAEDAANGVITWEDPGTAVSNYTSPPVVDDPDVQYFVTYVREINLHEDESGPSPLSVKTSMLQLRTLLLPKPPTTLLENGFTGWNIYRIGDTTSWLKVGSQSVDDGRTFVDTVRTGDLGDEPDSYYEENGVSVIFEPPPMNLQGIVMHSGMIFGIAGSTVRWTPVQRPDAWPAVFSYTFAHAPLALASFGGSIIVLCGDALYRIDGYEATSMTMGKTMVEDGCIAPRSVQATSHGLLYLSRRGVMLYNGVDATCLTEGRLPGSFFMTGSQIPSLISSFIFPSDITASYAALHGDHLWAGAGGGLARSNSMSNPLVGPIYNIRSFVAGGKYVLYWSNYI